MTREEWLQAGATELRNYAKQQGSFGIPEVRVSVGFPKGRGKNIVGECFMAGCSDDGVNQIFIHPKLVESTKVLAVLVHELIHASDDCASSHRGVFVERAKALGLVSPWTQTSPGFQLQQVLATIVEEIGEYPHRALVLKPKERKQTTRMIKVACPSIEHEPPYLIRMARSQMAEVGTPLCPQHSLTMEADLPEEEDKSGD